LDPDTTKENEDQQERHDYLLSYDKQALVNMIKALSRGTKEVPIRYLPSTRWETMSTWRKRFGEVLLPFFLLSTLGRPLTRSSAAELRHEQLCGVFADHGGAEKTGCCV